MDLLAGARTPMPAPFMIGFFILVGLVIAFVFVMRSRRK